MTEFHSDVQEVVVRVDGEEAFSYFKRDGGIDVLVDPEGPGEPPHHDP